MLAKSALLERVFCLLFADSASASISTSSAFRRPRLGLYAGSRARIARSSSGGMPSRNVLAISSVAEGLSV